MLLSLNIRDYAIIDRLSIDFDEGLNIITGETGAGKSIVIGALSLVLGAKSALENIRTGADRTVIQALFTLPEDNDEVLKLLDENGIDTEDGTLLISREITSKGRNLCRVNSSLVNVSFLKTLGENLVDIHGQHEHQKLLDQKTHLSFLDAYAADSLEETKNLTREAFTAYQSSLRELEKLEKMSRQKDDRLFILKKHVEDIDQIELEEGLDEALEKREKILMNSQDIFNNANEAYQILYGNDDNIVYSLSSVEDLLSEISEFDEEIEENLKMASDARAMAEEISYFLRDFRESVSYDENELNEIEEKLHIINQLKKKYGFTIAEILSHRESCIEEIDSLENYSERLSELKEEVRANEKKYLDEALKLRKIRKKASDEFTALVTENLHSLEMKGTVFTSRFTELEKEKKYTKDGIDDLVFMISTNRGQSLKPIDKVASGGEISRIMLSFKRVLAKKDSIDTLVFDEIDTGISGKTAQVVARQMWELSLNHQILSITHLAQIASMADTNYLIKKEVKDDNTVTSFRKLDKDEKVAELVRIISGENISKNANAYAKDMLIDANNSKIEIINRT